MSAERGGYPALVLAIIGIIVALGVLVGLLISANIYGPSVDDIIADLTYFQDPTSGACFVSYWSDFYTEFALSVVDCSMLDTHALSGY